MKTHRIRGAVPVDCDENGLDSIRAEKTRVLALITILRILEDKSDIGSGSGTVYCDNLEAVRIKQQHRHLISYVRFNGVCYDINEEVP